MNIQEAAKLVQDGILVRRAEWSRDKYLGLDDYGLYVRASGGNNLLQMHFHMSILDLLADDWEVYHARKNGRLSFRPGAKVG